ncbi:uncharacterized protein PFLUO_LOCUS7384 [Penicillium psychrofluorescens]|uniref:uncharacterized protein n=1 Tax=Penicillium psychrofluorescens TaxID=3158075 RepID=UPI003CCCDB07
MVRITLLAAALSAIATQCSASIHPPHPYPASPFLGQIAEQMALPGVAWTANGTHHAKGYTTKSMEMTYAKGMREDCENVNLNMKLSTNFRSDVFGPGVKGYFYKCEKINPETNQYWFTITSGNSTHIDRLCSQKTPYPITYDSQHSTWWIDEPFTCTQQWRPLMGEGEHRGRH